MKRTNSELCHPFWIILETVSYYSPIPKKFDLPQDRTILTNLVEKTYRIIWAFMLPKCLKIRLVIALLRHRPPDHYPRNPAITRSSAGTSSRKLSCPNGADSSTKLTGAPAALSA